MSSPDQVSRATEASRSAEAPGPEPASSPERGFAPDPPALEDLERDLALLVRAEREAEQRAGDRLAAVHPVRLESARNLVHYLALRACDLRPLQARLAGRGLSSLGRSEGHVLATLDEVRNTIALAGGWPPPPRAATLSMARAHDLAADHRRRLFGARTAASRGAGPEVPGDVPGAASGDVPGALPAEIMVTLPAEAADDPSLVRTLLDRGMDCARINTAHDDEATWARMLRHLRAAERETGRRCRVLMDLAGPKLRTGALVPGPRVVRLRPERDLLGRTLRPALAWLAPPSAAVATPAGAVHLPVAADFVDRLRAGGRLALQDTRGRRRPLAVLRREGAGVLCTAKRGARVVPGARVTLEGAEGYAPLETSLGDLPPVEVPIVLRPGDRLELVDGRLPGEPAQCDEAGRAVRAARIGCHPERILSAVRVGDPVWFDDGRIGGRVTATRPEGVEVEVTHAAEGGSRLRGGKGINLPGTDLGLPALTDDDLRILPFAAREADILGMSFVTRPEDVADLLGRLAGLGRRQVAIVLKIETRAGFDALPELLLEALRHPTVGVMIARGDLAVECGFERLAEVQEEVLWLCEAAHVPVIWATQVLETLARTGRPSRAEVTDAAMSERADCVMLNKGPFVAEAVATLASILWRMAGHQDKKMSMLRPLAVARRFLAAGG